MGIVNAINLDGGGSVTVLANGNLINRPSDRCPDDFVKCEREVSTVVCVHAPRCSPTECSDHPSCHSP
ncbi:N-acetylglucosamine-1-phosphodiester alpha-n-acetylglucosaminidase [Plakobranchus ocellatus]|uniref:N-acetylglucosamine-1-phosphodiester alpha-n-acetylglucosaminidase n=1 Tax=Plakobranchus ocellatus TaxID=259542 RepID=A0AAV4BJZ9_9GAST|nr:N-acetylglucosamine-1-phosphodiester alpha-n-acetylglucosaminidase [Plakobranchus ocellatus]